MLNFKWKTINEIIGETKKLSWLNGGLKIKFINIKNHIKKKTNSKRQYIIKTTKPSKQQTTITIPRKLKEARKGCRAFRRTPWKKCISIDKKKEHRTNWRKTPSDKIVRIIIIKLKKGPLKKNLRKNICIGNAIGTVLICIHISYTELSIVKSLYNVTSLTIVFLLLCPPISQMNV